jgi:hypothetical protein
MYLIDAVGKTNVLEFEPSPAYQLVPAGTTPGKLVFTVPSTNYSSANRFHIGIRGKTSGISSTPEVVFSSGGAYLSHFGADTPSGNYASLTDVTNIHNALGGGTTYTNEANTVAAGVVVGSQIGTNAQAELLTGTIAAARLAPGASDGKVLTYDGTGSTNKWSTGGGASETRSWINSSTGLVTYLLSGTDAILLIKTNATYNLNVVVGTTTNVIGGDGVWVEARPIGSSWVVRW